MDGQTDGLIDRQTNGCKNGETDKLSPWAVKMLKELKLVIEDLFHVKLFNY